MTEALIPAPSQISLTRDEVRRYSRHLIIPDIGVNGQQRLKDARVLCIGAGGLGSPALLYLAAAESVPSASSMETTWMSRICNAKSFMAHPTWVGRK